MATGNLILGTGRRSIGDVVMYRRNGQQVSRARVRKIKNPKSEGQYIQRVILQTVSQAYSRLREICDHSFQGRTVGQRNMSRFLQVNLNYLRQQVAAALNAGDSTSDVSAFIPLGTKYLAPNRYIVSEGVLPPVKVSVDGSAAGIIPYINANPTYEDIITALGLQRGDQLTFITVAGTYNASLGGDVYANADSVHFVYARIILDPRNSDGTAAPLTTPFLSNGAVNLPNPKNENTGVFELAVQENVGMVVSLPDYGTQAFGVIVSRRVGDGWQYSPCQLVVSEDASTSLWAVWDLATAILASQSSSLATSDLYLRQAEKKK